MRAKRDVLLDTGPLVAVLDARDQWHAQCASAWPALIDRCVVTEAVVVESCHLALRGQRGASLPLEFLLRAGIPIVGIEAPGHRRILSLMKQYEDVPMDYADATLVAVAEALRLTRVFSLDRRGFRTYRLPGGEGFHLLPES